MFFILPPPPPVPLHRITLDALMACRAFPFEKEGSITAAIADPGYTDAVVPRNPVAHLSLRADELGLLLSAVPLGETGFVAGWSDAARGDPVLAVFDPLTGDLAGGLTGKDLFVRPAYRGHGIGPEMRLVGTYEGFAVETLSMKGMMRNMGDSLGDIALGTFLRTLRYKSEWAGRTWYEHPRFFRSTGVCPDCGLVGPKLGRSVRRWTCDRCGVEHDRDVAAARVLEDCATGGVCAFTVAEESARRAERVEVGPARPEPVSARRPKRGSAVRGGGAANAVPSSGGSPSNDRQRGILASAG